MGSPENALIVKSYSVDHANCFALRPFESMRCCTNQPEALGYGDIKR